MERRRQVRLARGKRLGARLPAAHCGNPHVYAAFYPTAHAEIAVIRSACKTLEAPFLNGCILYLSSEPCPMCMSAIYWSCISTVRFATDRHAAARARQPAGHHLHVALSL
ncbi:deaminase [Tsuneonella suprasediminis]|uniref:deaminase n=1 Tax=Tsuneonella suprasediminis TaxID=2306996 RepID=UPI002F92B0A3